MAQMNESMGKTGNAQIKPLGQTAVRGYGSDPSVKAKGVAAETARPLKK